MTSEVTIVDGDDEFRPFLNLLDGNNHAMLSRYPATKTLPFPVV